MSNVLKGNFKTKKNVKGELEISEGKESLENQFEREALKRLGGSIAFVSKKKVMWLEKNDKKKKIDTKEKK